MEDFSDEVGREEFDEFLLYGIPSVIIKTTNMLLLGGSFRINLE
jgi:hypothetical protein